MKGMNWCEYASEIQLFVGKSYRSEKLPHAPSIPDCSSYPEQFAACPWKNNGSPGNRAEPRRPDPVWSGLQAGNRFVPKYIDKCNLSFIFKTSCLIAHRRIIIPDRNNSKTWPYPSRRDHLDSEEDNVLGARTSIRNVDAFVHTFLVPER